MPTTSSERYHAFDALRAAMMLLGVLLHSATAYSSFPDVWWLKDPHTTHVADALIIFLHCFRLPVFFVMSGFFAALLVGRRGAQGFLENRAARLGLPFLLGMLFMYPFLKLASVFAWALGSQPDPWAYLRAWLAQGRLERSIEPMHLWFLEVLMWLCLASAALAPRLNRWLSARWLRPLVTGRLAPLAWSAVSFLTLLMSEFGMLDTPHNFAPNFHIVAAYAVFFCFGWALYCQRHLLPRLARGGSAELALSLLSGAAAAFGIAQQAAHREARLWPLFLLTSACCALTAWLVAFGLIRLFLRFASAASPRQRYLSDAAYWLYLFHPPVLVALQIPMFWLPLAPELKLLAGFLIALPVLLLSYDRWVRPGWLGALLNGHRYPSGLPTPEHVTSRNIQPAAAVLQATR